MLAFFLICLQRYLKFNLDDPGIVERTINYISFAAITVTLDYSRLRLSSICLLLLLPIGFFIRRFLPIWILLGMVYQIIDLKIPIKQLATIAFITLCGEMLIQYWMVENGMVYDKVISTAKASGKMHTWGMKNGNNLAAFFLQIYIMLYIIVPRKSWWLYTLFALITGYGVYMYTCSRTPFYSLIIICLMVIFYHLRLLRSWNRYIIGALPIVLFGLTIYFSLYAKGTANLDDLTSGRIGLASYFFSNMTVSSILIGMPRPEGMPLDSAYIDMLMQGGIVYVTIFCIAFWKAVTSHFEEIEFYLPVLIGIIASGLAESTFTNLGALSLLTWVIIIRTKFSYKNMRYREILIAR